MHLGIISMEQNGELVSVTGVISRKGFVRDSVDMSRDASALDFIYLTAYSARTVIHDVVLPAPLGGRMLGSTLAFGLERILPVDIAEVSWGFLKTDKDNRHFRIFAILRSELNRILSNVIEQQLCCDAFVPAQIFTMGQAPELSPADNLLIYLVRDHGAKNLQLDSASIPRNIRPERYRWLKKIYRALILLSLLAILFLLLARVGRHVDIYAKIRTGEESAAEKMQQAQLEQGRLLSMQELALKVQSANYGRCNIRPILADLAARLPDYMWISDYKQNLDQIDITIISAQDENNMVRILESPLYTFVNMSKAVNPGNQSAVIIVKLRSNLP